MEIIGLIAALFIALQTIDHIPKLTVSAEINHSEIDRGLSSSVEEAESTE